MITATPAAAASATEPFWSSQLFGVIIGALVAGAIALAIEFGRRRSDRLERARNVRREIHTVALRAAYEAQDALIRMEVIAASRPVLDPEATAKDWKQRAKDFNKDWDAAYARYDLAWLRLSEAAQLERAFGTPDVHAAVRDLKGLTEWFAGILLDPEKPSEVTSDDYAEISEYLIDRLCVHARQDVGLGVGVKKSHSPTTAGEHSWLAMLENDEDAAAEATDGGTEPTSAPHAPK